ncbi:MAG: hypothetical protein WC627_05875 [Legionella sp.]|jgi:hypothetical protein
MIRAAFKYYFKDLSMPPTAQATLRPPIHIGRMSAEMSTKAILDELTTELKKEGYEQISQKLKIEKAVLDELTSQKQQIESEIDQKCMKPALERAAKGYNVTGVFWSETQKKLHQIITREELIKREEQIDWLDARNKLFEQLGR